MKVNRTIVIIFGFSLILGGLLGMFLTKDQVHENLNWQSNGLMYHSSRKFDDDSLTRPDNFIFQDRTHFHGLYGDDKFHISNMNIFEMLSVNSFYGQVCDYDWHNK